MENNLTIKTYMAIMAERDAAIRERNMALEERRRAFAERDMAMLQRDAAMSERNSAMEERDKALSALQYRESSMNENNISPDSPEHAIPHGGEKHMYHHQNHHHQQQQQMHYMPHMVESGYDPRDIGTGTSNPNPNPNPNPFQSQELACDETVKPKKAKQTKGSSTKKPTKGKRVHQEFTPVTGASSDDQENDLEFGHEGDDGLDGHMMVWKDNLGLNQINFDETTMPVPVCSCTGIPQPCYKWGNGGWQSACCTTTMSMYPLPQMSNKRHTRVGGRKMSGTVFSKLLNRLAAEGVDLYAPLDLKDYWAKHGTNRYSTLK